MAFSFSTNLIVRTGQMAAIKEQLRILLDGSPTENFVDMNTSAILWQDPDTDEWNVNYFRIDDEGTATLDAMPSMTFEPESM